MKIAAKIQLMALCTLWLGLIPTASNASSAVTFTPPAESDVPAAASTSSAATRSTFIPPAESDAPAATSTSSAATRSTYMSPTVGEPPAAATANAAAGAACTTAGTPGLQALLPERHNYGTTLRERPTILVHLPATQAARAFFSLKVNAADAAERTLYTTVIPLTPNRAGILSWQLPADAPALEVGQDYHWYFALQCGDRIQIDDPYVDGWVRRIHPPAALSAPLPTEDVAAAYGRAGIWYDLLAKVAARYQRQPDSAAAVSQWRDLLTSETVGLEQLDDAPLFLRP